uniref:PHD finger protein 20-like protein 1 n=1 Tax=Callorhinchus milii TaxID=7868 RepID=A0A4W3GJF2_CALMI
MGSFQAKRARLNKITGLLASKAVSGDGMDLVEDGGGTHPDQLLASEASDQLKTKASERSHPTNQGTRPLPSAPSPGKARTRKPRADETFGNPKPCEPSPIPPAVSQGDGTPSVDFAQTLPLPSPPDIPQTDLRSLCLISKGARVSELRCSVPLDLSQTYSSKTVSSSPAPLLPSKARLVRSLSSTLSTGASATSSLSVPASHWLTSPPVTPFDRSLREPKPSPRVPGAAQTLSSPLGWPLRAGTTLPAAAGRSAEAETLHQKLLRKCIDRDRRAEVGKKKVRSKVKREQERAQATAKKKKKKKPLEFGCDRLKEPPLCRVPGPTSSLALRPTTAAKPAFLSPKCLLPTGSLLELSVERTPKHEDLSSDEFPDGSSTESALGSEDGGQDPGSSSPAGEQPSEDDRDEIVRCVCHLDEEKGFMIQCEDCLCWQHSVCMGLVEDSIPDQYACPFCQNTGESQELGCSQPCWQSIKASSHPPHPPLLTLNRGALGCCPDRKGTLQM